MLNATRKNRPGANAKSGKMATLSSISPGRHGKVLTPFQAELPIRHRIRSYLKRQELDSVSQVVRLSGLGDYLQIVNATSH